MRFAKKFVMKRKELKMTQAEVAEKLNVSFQAVSLWERGETTPDISKLSEIAKLFHVTIDWLLADEMMTDSNTVLGNYHISKPKDRFFNEEHMYTYIKTYAAVKHMDQTIKALSFAREMHKGQYRKGDEKVPYIYHPLLVACQALSLGMDSDDMIATALLHDVCEDCGVTPEEIPVNDGVKKAVALLTKDAAYDSKSYECKEKYYNTIAKNGLATMVKILDRCNNISGIAGGFTRKRMLEYIEETEEWFYPLIRNAKTDFPEYSNPLFAMKYHIISVVEAIKHML